MGRLAPLASFLGWSFCLITPLFTAECLPSFPPVSRVGTARGSRLCSLGAGSVLPTEFPDSPSSNMGVDWNPRCPWSDLHVAVGVRLSRSAPWPPQPLASTAPGLHCPWPELQGTYRAHIFPLPPSPLGDSRQIPLTKVSLSRGFPIVVVQGWTRLSLKQGFSDSPVWRRAPGLFLGRGFAVSRSGFGMVSQSAWPP